MNRVREVLRVPDLLNKGLLNKYTEKRVLGWYADSESGDMGFVHTGFSKQFDANRTDR